jgi:hypothetical protein
VEQVVTRLRAKLPAPFFLRAEAGKVKPPLLGILREQSGKKLGDPLRVDLHDLTQPFLLPTTTLGKAGESILARAIGDVLVVARVALPLAQQKLPGIIRQAKGAFRKVQYVSLLEVLIIFSQSPISLASDRLTFTKGKMPNRY